MRLPAHWFDYRSHKCGCITYFDMARWSSICLQRCREHGDTA